MLHIVRMRNLGDLSGCLLGGKLNLRRFGFGHQHTFVQLFGNTIVQLL